MVALLIILAILAMLGVLGAVIEGLLWLTLIAVVLFVAGSAYAWFKLKPSR